MIEIASKKIELKSKNEVILKNIELDNNLNCFILIDTEDDKFWDIILNKLLDNIIWKISSESAYKDFSIALENTNTIIKSWKNNEWIKWEVNIFAAVLEEKNLIFSTIWSASCYLVKKDNEIVEITEKDDCKKEFSFISNWDIKNEETIIICSDKLLHHVSRSDIIESLDVENLEDFIKNLEITLFDEKINKNLWFIAVKNSYFKEIKTEPLFCIKNYCFKAMDNDFTKKTIALYMLAKEKVSKQKKSIKTVLLFMWIIISFFVLYSMISSISTKTSQTQEVNELKKDLQNSKKLVELAQNNINNPDIFSENIKKADALLSKLRDKNMYLTDVEKISWDIISIKKQFNLVETFEERNDNLVYKDIPSWTSKIYNLNWNIYLITKNSLLWPIVAWKDSKEYFFNDIWDDSFVDITSIDWQIFLVTKKWRIVSFEKTGFFKFYDVKWQAKWEDFKSVETYSSYLYTLSTSWNQIFRHRKFWQEFEKGTTYLEEWNKDTQNIIDIWIDWWIYLLKNDLSISKVFRSPSFRVQNLVLNKFPKIYSIEKWTSAPRIITWAKLKYVYLYLNNKIRVLRTDAHNFSQTKSLTYVWQIDWINKIIDFSIYRDWEVFVLNKNWVFRINFEVSDNKLILK